MAVLLVDSDDPACSIHSLTTKAAIFTRLYGQISSLWS